MGDLLPALIVGSIFAALGAGFVISAVVSYLLSSKWGLLTKREGDSS